MKVNASHHCFGGTLHYMEHESNTTNCRMRFTVFVPPKPTSQGVIYLSGLTCSEENFTTKAGAYRTAAALNLTVIAPDTSPRGQDVPDDDSIALGSSAGGYVDATESPWNTHYKMYSYITKDIVNIARNDFSLKELGLMGHSMGGHGALTIAQRHPDIFSSLSALAPVCHPAGKKGGTPLAFMHYLGNDRSAWEEHDATVLMRNSDGDWPEILVDIGLDDEVYIDGRLKPEAFKEACEQVGQRLNMRFHPHYDHGYFFVQSFIDDHLQHHAKILRQKSA